MKRPVRIALIAVVALIVLIVAAGGIFLATFDPNTYKPDIQAAVKRATGRDLALNGRIGVKLSLTPTLEAQDVALSNPPGFSRPQMATLQALELEIAVFPLLSGEIQIDRLVLKKPDILLETDSQGQPNWQLTPEVSPSAPPVAQAPSPSGKAKTAVSIQSVRIDDGTIAYRDGRTGKAMKLGLTKLDASAASPEAPLHVTMDAIYNGATFGLVADTGSLIRLQDPAATTPWPVRVALTMSGATLSADGQLTQPMQGKGYALTVNGAVANLATLAPLLPGTPLPPLHDVRFSAKVADSGKPVPSITAMMAHVGPSDLGSVRPGLSLAGLDVKAPSTDQPMQVNAAARFGDTPLSIEGTLGAPALLMPDAKPAPFPVDVAVKAADASFGAKGQIANAQALTGANVVVTAQIPDLGKLSPLAGSPLPAVKQIAFKGSITDADGGFRNGAAIRGISLTSPDADLAGDVVIGLRPRPSATIALSSNHIDWDALQRSLPPPAAPPSGAPQPSQAPAPKHNERIFSEQPLPLGLLRSADADVKLTVATLRANGGDTRSLDVHAVLKNGNLVVDRFSGDLPAGRLAGTLSADASQPAPPVHLTLHAPGLALKSLQEMAREPVLASGNLEVYADLSGKGDSPHAIASTLDGSLGLAVANGNLDNRVLGSVLGKVLEAVNLLDLVGKGGNSELRCFAVRAQARNGVAAVAPLVLSSSLLTMTGSGDVNLGAESLAMTLRPQVRMSGTNLVIPVNVSGPIRNPAVAVNKVGAAESNAGTVAGAVIGNATPLGIVGGLLGADKALGIGGGAGGGGGDVCAPALAAARGQKVGAAPATTPGATTPGAKPPAAKAPGPAIPNPESALKSLFR